MTEEEIDVLARQILDDIAEANWESEYQLSDRFIEVVKKTLSKNLKKSNRVDKS